MSKTNKYTTITETLTLPSKSLVYDQDFNPNFTMRSMTTAEEMKRLSYAETPYKALCEIIDDCILEDLPISSYDFCLGDFQYALYKLRIITYGSEYKLKIKCPVCQEWSDSITNLDDLEVIELEEDIRPNMFITLPASKKEVKLRLQTPRDLDSINTRKKEKHKKMKDNLDYGILYTITTFIEEVDGRRLNPIELENFVLELPMKDVNYILKEGDNWSKKIGFTSDILVKCGNCGVDIPSQFKITSEFFNPTTI